MGKRVHRIAKVKKRRKIHPLFAIIGGFLGVVLIAIMLTAQVYKNVSPMEEVAGAHTQSDDAFKFPTATPTPTNPGTCVIANRMTGIGACGNDMYKGVSIICGDGTKATFTNKQCKSLTAWFTQVAHACAGHSTCKIPTPTPNTSATPTPAPPSPHPQPTITPSASF